MSAGAACDVLQALDDPWRVHVRTQLYLPMFLKLPRQTSKYRILINLFPQIKSTTGRDVGNNLKAQFERPLVHYITDRSDFSMVYSMRFLSVDIVSS